jgi:hypothetical protein
MAFELHMTLKKLQDFLDKDHVPSKDEHWQ